MNRYELAADDPAITDTGITLARLISQTNERRKEKKKIEQLKEQI